MKELLGNGSRKSTAGKRLRRAMFTWALVWRRRDSCEWRNGASWREVQQSYFVAIMDAFSQTTSTTLHPPFKTADSLNEPTLPKLESRSDFWPWYCLGRGKFRPAITER